VQDVQLLVDPEQPEEKQAEVLAGQLQRHVLRRAAADIRPRPPLAREVLLPVAMTDKQADCYMTVLARWAGGRALGAVAVAVAVAVAAAVPGSDRPSPQAVAPRWLAALPVAFLGPPLPATPHPPALQVLRGAHGPAPAAPQRPPRRHAAHHLH
jgi:hypothetical protein